MQVVIGRLTWGRQVYLRPKSAADSKQTINDLVAGNDADLSARLSSLQLSALI